MSDDTKIRVHIKSNRHAPDTFPNTPEGEAVFTITPERYATAASHYPDVARHLDVFIDMDTDHWETSMQTAEVLVCWNLPTDNLAAVAPKLKWIHIIGAGVEHLNPMSWLPAEVQLVNNKGVHAAKAGEFGAMSLLMLHSHMPAIVTNQRSATYASLYSTPIAGKTVAVIGVGSIGKAVAAQAKRLGLHVLGVSRHGKPVAAVDEMYPQTQIDAVLPRANYVFVATPLTAETRNLFDRRRLDLLKPGAGVVNIGRAGVMDYQALSEKLIDGSIGGAILDVFDPEPLPADSPYWQVPNLIVCPHISADDGNAYVPDTLDLFFRNMQCYLSGAPLLNPVRPELGY